MDTKVDNKTILWTFPFNKLPQFTACSARAEITLPRVVRDLLMLAPSLSRVPLAPVDSARSDPARSTSEILLT